jgi:magnesium-transporting ATPase (P-type)
VFRTCAEAWHQVIIGVSDGPGTAMTTLTTPEHHLPDHVPGEALHDLPAHEAIVLLGSHPHAGLDEDEVRARRDRFGPNVLPEGRRRGPLVRFLVQFKIAQFSKVLLIAILALAA